MNTMVSMAEFTARPRPYQATLMRKVVADLNLRGSALLIAPTGTGKTFMIGMALNAMAGRRALLIQSRVDLVAQNGRAIARQCAGHRVFCTTDTASKWASNQRVLPASASVIVATVQGLSPAVLDAYGRFDMLMIDETHHAPADSYRAVIAHLRKANPGLKLFGTTATPRRADNRQLDSIFGREAVDQPALLTVREALALGVLVPVVPLRLDEKSAIVARAFARAASYGFDDGNAERSDHDADLGIRWRLPKVALEEVVRLWRIEAGTRRSLAYCSNVAEAEALARVARARGVDAVVISHKTSAAERQRILDDLRADRGAMLVCNATLLLEGIDVPPVSCVLLLRRVAHKSTLIQIIGRAMRPFAGKSNCLVLDCVGACKDKDIIAELDMHTAEREPSGGTERTRQGDDREATLEPVIGLGEGAFEPFTLLPPIAFEAVDWDCDEEGGDGGEQSGGQGESDDGAAPPVPLVARSRAEAMALGLTTYTTGKPCKHGHVAWRHRSGDCCICLNVRNRKRHVTPEGREVASKWHATPEAKAKKNQRRHKLYVDPEIRAKNNQRRRKLYADPEIRAKIIEDNRKWRARKKAERMAVAEGVAT